MLCVSYFCTENRPSDGGTRSRSNSGGPRVIASTRARERAERSNETISTGRDRIRASIASFARERGFGYTTGKNHVDGVLCQRD